MDNYLGEAGRYKRPIVTNVYNEPIDLFDRHLYEKGGIVLNMLRVLLGETLFWKAIRRYVDQPPQHTTSSRRTCSAPSRRRRARNLDWFFDQWVYGAGHPELKGDYAWDDDDEDGEDLASSRRSPATTSQRSSACRCASTSSSRTAAWRRTRSR